MTFPQKRTDTHLCHDDIIQENKHTKHEEESLKSTRQPNKIYHYKKDKTWIKISRLYMANSDKDHTQRKEVKYKEEVQTLLILHRCGIIKVDKGVIPLNISGPDEIIEFKLTELTKTENNNSPDCSYYEIASGCNRMLSYTYDGIETQFFNGIIYELFQISTKAYIDHDLDDKNLSTDKKMQDIL